MKTYYFSLAGAEGVQVDVLAIEADRMRMAYDDSSSPVYTLFRDDEVIAEVDRGHTRAWRVEDQARAQPYHVHDDSE